MKKIFPYILILITVANAYAQGIVTSNPTTAAVGQVGILVTLDMDANVAPPGPIQPTSVTIGPYVGYSITRNSTTVSATFDFTLENEGIYSVIVTFPGPPPGTTNVSFTYPAGFRVTSNTPKTIWNVSGTGITVCYDTIAVIPCSNEPTVPFSGQTNGTPPHFENNGNGTISDLVTGLMWQQDPGPKVTYREAVIEASSLNLGGFADWRLPTIKELYSLIVFTGIDPSGIQNGYPLNLLTPFIDTNYFIFKYGDTLNGERIIDAQYWSCTEFVSTVLGGNYSIFGVNFADGRIKSYPRTIQQGNENKMFCLYVRNNVGYGRNDFFDNGDSTISDHATNLMWAKYDAGLNLNWEEALAYAQQMNLKNYAGYNDWTLPTTKELESIVDYTRCPQTTQTPSIDPIFQSTAILNELGETDYSSYWTSTTHFNNMAGPRNACYVSFGKSMGYAMGVWQDVHGAGAQRSDPKQGDPSSFPFGHGPQGDAIRIYNQVRLVRNIGSTGMSQSSSDEQVALYPNPAHTYILCNIKSERYANVEFRWRDVLGNLILSTKSSMNKGEQKMQLDCPSIAGLYFVELVIGEKHVFKKVVVE